LFTTTTKTKPRLNLLHRQPGQLVKPIAMIRTRREQLAWMLDANAAMAPNLLQDRFSADFADSC
jgi:hypothetical protein